MDASDGQIMVEALADFLKIAHGPVHQKVAETSELVETQKSCFASGDEMVGSTLTESSKSEELIQFGICEVLSALESVCSKTPSPLVLIFFFFLWSIVLPIYDLDRFFLLI